MNECLPGKRVRAIWRWEATVSSKQFDQKTETSKPGRQPKIVKKDASRDCTSLKIGLVCDDLSKAEICISAPDALMARLELTAEQLDVIIAELGQLRGSMQPSITRDLENGSVFKALRDPRWRIERDEVTTDFTVLLRHPGFGWIAFVFPAQTAEKIARFLLRYPPTRRKDPTVLH